MVLIAPLPEAVVDVEVVDGLEVVPVVRVVAAVFVGPLAASTLAWEAILLAEDSALDLASPVAVAARLVKLATWTEAKLVASDSTLFATLVAVETAPLAKLKAVETAPLA